MTDPVKPPVNHTGMGDPRARRRNIRAGSRIVSPPPRTAGRVLADEEPVPIILPWNNFMPYNARRFQRPAPPYRATIAAAAVDFNIATLDLDTGEGAIIESIEATVEEPVGLPVLTWDFRRDNQPLDELGLGITLDHPFSQIIGEDIRMRDGEVFTVDVSNPGAVLFHTFLRIRGYRFSMDDVPDLSAFFGN